MDGLTPLTLDHESIQAERRSESPTVSAPFLRRFVFALVLLVCAYLNYVCSGLSSSFYPQEAKHRKGSRADTEVGIMIGGNQLAAAVSSVVVGVYMKSLRVKFILVMGPLVVGCCTVLFGFLGRVDTWASFIGLSIAIYFVMGFGQTAFTTAANTIVVTLFPTHVAVVWALVGFALGLGFVTGAPLGGSLYDSEGFFFPFVIIGGLLLLFVPLLFIFRSDTHCISAQVNSESQVSMWSLLKIIPVFIVCVNQFIALAPITVLQTSLPIFLYEEFGWRPSHIGLVFLLLAGTYVGSSIAVGILVDATNPRLVMIIGLLIEGCGMMYVGPSFLFSSLPPKPLATYISMALIGFGISMVTTAAPPDVINAAVSRGYKKNVSLNGVVAGLINAATFLSGGVCSPISGALTASFGFRYSTSYFAFIIFLLFVVTVVCSVAEQMLSSKFSMQQPLADSDVDA